MKKPLMPASMSAALIQKLLAEGKIFIASGPKPENFRGTLRAARKAKQPTKPVRQFDDHGMPIPNDGDPIMDERGRITYP